MNQFRDICLSCFSDILQCLGMLPLESKLKEVVEHGLVFCITEAQVRGGDWDFVTPEGEGRWLETNTPENEPTNKFTLIMGKSDEDGEPIERVEYEVTVSVKLTKKGS